MAFASIEMDVLMEIFETTPCDNKPSVTHVVHPDGNVLIVLMDPNLPFVVYDPTAPHVSLVDMDWASGKGLDRPPAELKPGLFAPNPSLAGNDPRPTYLAVGDSLRRASPFFNRALSEPPNGGNGALRCIGIFGFDEAALFIVLRAINGGLVPRELSPMMIGKVAAVAEHLECAELMTPLYDCWRENLHPWLVWEPGCITSVLISILYSSLVFKDHVYFYEAVAAAIQYADGLLPTLGLPIPWELIRRIDDERQARMERIFVSLQDPELIVREIDARLHGYSDECKMACHSVVMAEVGKSGWVPAPAAPFLRQSLWDIVGKAQDFEDPPVHHTGLDLPYDPVRSPGTSGNLPHGHPAKCSADPSTAMVEWLRTMSEGQHEIGRGSCVQGELAQLGEVKDASLPGWVRLYVPGIID